MNTKYMCRNISKIVETYTYVYILIYLSYLEVSSYMPVAALIKIAGSTSTHTHTSALIHPHLEPTHLEVWRAVIW
jgi:hypothetical protein